VGPYAEQRRGKAVQLTNEKMPQPERRKNDQRVDVDRKFQAPLHRHTDIGRERGTFHDKSISGGKWDILGREWTQCLAKAAGKSPQKNKGASPNPKRGKKSVSNTNQPARGSEDPNFPHSDGDGRKGQAERKL